MILTNISIKDLDKKIYRIISLERLLELFVLGENTLVKPALWEDIFENFILKQPVRHLDGSIINYNYHDWIYGQCWTMHRASDAMWRIYSSDKQGLRVRTTIRKLVESLVDTHSFPEAKCRVGKVEYLSEKKLMEVANSTFDDSGIGVDEIFRSLLVKRRAFIHENEVRALYMELDDSAGSEKIYRYSVDPHSFIEQIMIDPRKSYDEFLAIKNILVKATGFKGEIKRSLLYTLPKNISLSVTNIFGESST